MIRKVYEIYSPPRVTAAARILPELRCIPGFALDLATLDENCNSWDFDDPEQRKRAKARVEKERPMLLVGGPMCTAFSCLLYTSPSPRDRTRSRMPSSA